MVSIFDGTLLSQEDEEWRPLPEWPGYSASNIGRIKSPRKILTLCALPTGYLQVNVSRNGKAYHRYVHRLVLEAFVGSCPEGMECRHLDGNPANNHLNNLVWGTSREQWADKVRRGTDRRGSNHPDAILTEDQVTEIRKMWDLGVQQNEIARMFSISKSHVNSICLRRTWTHLSGGGKKPRPIPVVVSLSIEPGTRSECCVDFAPRPIPGYSMYRLFWNGQVQSRLKNGVTWRNVKSSPSNQGYFSISLVNDEGKRKRHSIHVLVLTVFKGPKPSPGMFARHLDDDKRHNHSDNLAWGTQAQNMKDMVANCRSNRGTRNPNAKLTEEDVREIRRDWLSGVKVTVIAETYDISSRRVYRIVRGEIWSHVQS